MTAKGANTSASQKSAEPQVQQQPIPESNDVLLAQYGLQDLPEAFSTRDEVTGQFSHEKEACYLCLADGFYGKGTAGTWYQEGSIIVSDMIPNEQLQPLNKAAGLALVKWYRSLPQNRVHIDIGDMAEASQMLAKNPQVHSLGPVEYQAALIKLCEEIKIRREGKDARTIPSMGHNFTSSRASNAPPLLGAKLSDMTQRGPGHTQAQPVIPAGQSGGARRVLGGTPPLPN